MRADPREFEALEAEYNTFELRVDSIQIWEWIRFAVFREIQEQKGADRAQPRLQRRPMEYLKGFGLWLRNWVYRNPFLASPAEVMFVGHPRRKKGDDGMWWDICSDPIHQAETLDSVHFESHRLLEHRAPAKTEGLRYLDLITLGGFLIRTLGLNSVTIPPDVVDQLQEIEKEIVERFDTEVDLIRNVRDTLEQRASTLWLYKRLLDHVDPNVVVIVVGYGRRTLIEACRERGVPVVELQHGIIHRSHFGYHFATDRRIETFPDYLFTWGEYWAKSADFPVEDNRIVPTGFPYLEMEREKYTDVETRDQILFISQGVIGSDLSRFAVEFFQLNPDLEVVYKLHPGEYDCWEADYPWLVQADFRVVDDESVALYKLFAESSIQVGVFSTAILEGLVFDLDTYLIDLHGKEALSFLYENGFASVVHSPAELLEHVSRSSDPPTADIDSLFERGALSRTVDSLQTIASEHDDG